MVKVITLEDVRRETLAHFLRPIVRELFGDDWITERDVQDHWAVVRKKRHWNSWFPVGYISMFWKKNKIHMYVDNANIANATKLGYVLETHDYKVTVHEE